jgi:hypothetical protein
MKVELLRLGVVNKPSLIFKGVAEIWINNQPCKGNNLTTWHTWATEATIYDVVKESGRVQPHPSAVFHAYGSADKPWVAGHYPV